MKIKNVILLPIAAAFLMLSSTSHAFFAEPILGYKTGTIKQTGSIDQTLKGVYLGGRVGIGIPIVPFLWVALDGGIVTGGKIESPGSEIDADQTLVGLSVGVDIPMVPIIDRVWLGYNFIDEIKSGTTSIKTKGSSIKAGLGLKFVPFVSLNVEYIKETWDEQDSVALTSNIESNALLFSVSVPLP